MNLPELSIYYLFNEAITSNKTDVVEKSRNEKSDNNSNNDGKVR